MGDVSIGNARVVTDQFYDSATLDQVRLDGNLNSNETESAAHLEAIGQLEQELLARARTPEERTEIEGRFTLYRRLVDHQCGDRIPRQATWLVQGLYEELNQFNQSSGFTTLPRNHREQLQRRLVGLQADCLSWLRARGADRRSTGYQNGTPEPAAGTAAESPRFSNPDDQAYRANPQALAGVRAVGSRVDFTVCGFNEGDTGSGRGQSRFSFYTNDVTGGQAGIFGVLEQGEHESDEAYLARLGTIDVNLDDRYETLTINEPEPAARPTSAPAPADSLSGFNADDPGDI